MGTWGIYVLLVVFGVTVGSFLNVVIHRLPQQFSIVFPPSACPCCGHRLTVRDLFPVISYLTLRGKCRYCREPISVRYPIVEVISAGLFVLAWIAAQGNSFLFIKLLVFSELLLVIACIDLQWMIIPDELSLGGTVVALLFAVFEKNLVTSLLGGLSGAGLILLIFLFGLLVYRQETIGGGDIKMMMMTGAFWGWQAVFLSTFIAMFLGGIVGILLILFRLKSRKDFIPFGPFLSLGSLAGVYMGEQLLQAYVSILWS